MPFNGLLSALSLKRVRNGRKQVSPGTSSLAAQRLAAASSSTLLDAHKGPAVSTRGIKANKGIVHSIVTAEVTAAEQDDEPSEVLPERAAGTSTSRIRPPRATKDKGTKIRTRDATGYDLLASCLTKLSLVAGLRLGIGSGTRLRLVGNDQ